MSVISTKNRKDILQQDDSLIDQKDEWRGSHSKVYIARTGAERFINRRFEESKNGKRFIGFKRFSKKVTF